MTHEDRQTHYGDVPVGFGLVTETEIVIDPEPFQKGRRRALEAILERIDRLPEDLLTKTRDEGRGVSHARDLLRPVVERLLADPTWIPDPESA